jgi:hypothetical protein
MEILGRLNSRAQDSSAPREIGGEADVGEGGELGAGALERLEADRSTNERALLADLLPHALHLERTRSEQHGRQTEERRSGLQ